MPTTQNLVKRIKVTGFRISGASASSSYLYLQSINQSSTSAPTATIEFEQKGNAGVRFTKRVLREGDNLYELSGGLEEYRDRFTVSGINAASGTVEFMNGQKLAIGEVAGHVDDEQLRRLQIRETIQVHLERESVNFSPGIKTLSLFYIDEVAKYRKDGMSANGIYAAIIEAVCKRCAQAPGSWARPAPVRERQGERMDVARLEQFYFNFPAHTHMKRTNLERLQL